MVEFSAVFAVKSCADVVAVLTRPDFVSDVADELAIESHETSLAEHDSILEHDLRLTFSTQRIPRPFNRIVPAHVTVDWHTSWTPLPDGSYASSFHADAQQPRADFTGSSTLRSAGGQVRWELSGGIEAERSGLVPARAIESGLSRLLISVLEDEAAVAQRWLAR